MLTKEIVRELLDYDPVSGKLTWKERDAKWFKDNSRWTAEDCCKAWNSRYANKEAFTSINTHGYLQGTILGKVKRAHQIIFLWMTGEFCSLIDHEDQNKLNNAWYNLKKSNKSKNGKNQKLNINNKSGQTGVTWSNIRGKWEVRILGKFIGYYLEFDEAVKIRKDKEKLHGFNINHGRSI